MHSTVYTVYYLYFFFKYAKHKELCNVKFVSLEMDSQFRLLALWDDSDMT